MQQFLSFVASGACGTAVHYLVLVLSVHAGVQPVVASFAGAACGAVINYFLNFHFTFAGRAAHRSSAPRFVLVAALLAIVNTVLMFLFVHPLGVHYFVAQVMTTALVLGANFLVSRFWTFA
jgi:putative flippase GtrA